MATNSNKKIFIIAGEQSGDKIGGLVIKKIKSLSSESLDIRGVGGEMIEQTGLKSLFPMNEISLMGFLEIIPHIFKLKHLINLTLETITEFDPDIIITIDSPGFCYRICKALKGKVRAKFVHIVAPSVWAYKPERAKKFAEVYDLLLTLLPIEPPYFIKEGLKTVFVGHFVFEQYLCTDKTIFREKYNIPLNDKILCVTPGSRKGEINRHLPIFEEAIIELQKTYQIRPVFLAAGNEIKNFIDDYLKKSKLKNAIIITGDKFEAYKAADVALAKSGTNSLEIALHETPQIIAYKLNWLSWFYIKTVALINYASLINILSNKEIIPEFLQSKCRADLLAKSLSNLLSNKDLRDKQIYETKQILKTLKNDNKSASTIAAEEILKLFDKTDR